MKTTNGNQRGGRRPGAGRPKGSANKRTREIADRAMSEGLTPLDYMLSVLRDEEADAAARFEAAKAAAPYIHPRLSAIDANVKGEIALPPETMAWLDQRCGI